LIKTKTIPRKSSGTNANGELVLQLALRRKWIQSPLIVRSRCRIIESAI
jgi:hypothetical protein